MGTIGYFVNKMYDLTQFVKYVCPGCKKEISADESSGYDGYFLHIEDRGGCGYSGNQSNIIEVFDVESAKIFVAETSNDLRRLIDDVEENFIDGMLKDRMSLENLKKMRGQN